ncbi:expressed unknown protein [Seminavis robusta]|uniref:Uncharacterized protein n=1 Tax=Seminavis robusta TaxID=568900 RepID=A0A9N8DRN7_9STRA|nr:expressed unknown protein [Seminavis robusta]|eukprot:Sro303_g112420.1 n/a (282) ;mRNA; r:38672-39517
MMMTASLQTNNFAQRCNMMNLHVQVIPEEPHSTNSSTHTKKMHKSGSRASIDNLVLRRIQSEALHKWNRPQQQQQQEPQKNAVWSSSTASTKSRAASDPMPKPLRRKESSRGRRGTASGRSSARTTTCTTTITSDSSKDQPLLKNRGSRPCPTKKAPVPYKDILQDDCELLTPSSGSGSRPRPTKKIPFKDILQDEDCCELLVDIVRSRSAASLSPSKHAARWTSSSDDDDKSPVAPRPSRKSRSKRMPRKIASEDCTTERSAVKRSSPKRVRKLSSSSCH